MLRPWLELTVGLTAAAVRRPVVTALALAPAGHVITLAFPVFMSLRLLSFSSSFFSFRFLYIELPILQVSPYLLACPCTPVLTEFVTLSKARLYSSSCERTQIYRTRTRTRTRTTIETEPDRNSHCKDLEPEASNYTATNQNPGPRYQSPEPEQDLKPRTSPDAKLFGRQTQEPDQNQN